MERMPRRLGGHHILKLGQQEPNFILPVPNWECVAQVIKDTAYRYPYINGKTGKRWKKFGGKQKLSSYDSLWAIFKIPGKI